MSACSKDDNDNSDDPSYLLSKEGDDTTVSSEGSDDDKESKTTELLLKDCVRPSVIVLSGGERIDITKKHELAGDQVSVPSLERKAFYWNFYHVGFKSTSLRNKDKQPVPVAVCNICCQFITISNRNYSSLERHLSSTKHIQLYRDACAQHKDMLSQSQLATMTGTATSRSLLATMKGTATNCSKKQGSTLQKNTLHFTRKQSHQEVAKEKADLALAALDAHVKFRAETFTPLQRFEHQSFRELLDVVAQCGVKGASYHFSEHKIRSRTTTLAHIGREHLKKQIQGQVVTVTTDHWTSRRGHTYATLTVQFIPDDFILRSLVLGVYHYSGSTTGERIYQDLKQQLKRWGIEHTSNLAPFLVTDTAPNMNAVGVSLEKNDDTPMEHVYCLDHVVQLIAKFAFEARIHGEALETIDDQEKSDDEETSAPSLMKKVRALIGYFNRSSQAQEALETIAQEVAKEKQDDTKAFTLIQDVITRWWSTLTAVERLLKLKESIIRLFYSTNESNLKNWAGQTQGGQKKKPPSLPTPDEWNALRQLTVLLSPFKEAQKTLSGKKYVTSSLAIPYLLNISKNLSELTEEEEYMNETVRSLAEKMKDEFSKHFGDIERSFTGNVVRGARQRQVGLHPAFYKAYALDPRTKDMKRLQQWTKQKIWDDILTELIELGPEENLEQGESDGGGGSGVMYFDMGKKQFLSDTEDNSSKVVAAVASPLKKKQKTDVELEISCFELEEMIDDDDDKAESNKTRKQKGQVPFSTICRLEMDKFQATPGLKMFYSVNGKKFLHDPLLSWWKGKANEFPNIWRLAKKYLAMPATAASSERAFSIAGLIVTAKQSSFDPSTVTDLHFLRENWGNVF